MKSIHSQQFAEGKLPVFVFPASLTFYANDQSSHKQVLTLYNPYEFTLLFKVLCNNPSKYNVVESEGCIKPRCCVDIVVRTTDILPDLTREDKFRIQVYEHGISKLLGKKDIPAIFLPSSMEVTRTRRGSYKRHSSMEMEEMSERHQKASVAVERTIPSIPVMLLSLACIVALMLPTKGDENANPSIPPYLHMTVSQKLIAAYVLGLITMSLLKT